MVTSLYQIRKRKRYTTDRAQYFGPIRAIKERTWRDVRPDLRIKSIKNRTIGEQVDMSDRLPPLPCVYMFVFLPSVTYNPRRQRSLTFLCIAGGCTVIY